MFHTKMLAADMDVIVAACGNLYAGTIKFATDNYIKIQAIDLKSSTAIESKFYKNEVTFIECLKQHHIPKVDTGCNLTLNELIEVSQMVNNIVYIERFDRAYHDAISAIESEPFVGFYMPLFNVGRFSEQTNTVIACSTTKVIYIFDIVVLGRIEKALKQILQSNVPKKVIHDACEAADYLKHSKNIDLNGVFDTMVAHCTLGFDKGRIDLYECLADHFKLPEFFLSRTNVQWHRRPLKSNDRKQCAENVVFLLKLKTHFSRLMLKDLYAN